MPILAARRPAAPPPDFDVVWSGTLERTGAAPGLSSPLMDDSPTAATIRDMRVSAVPMHDPRTRARERDSLS